MSSLSLSRKPAILPPSPGRGDWGAQPRRGCLRPQGQRPSFQLSATSSHYPASSFSFALGAHDPSQPLVIDPVVLAYCR